MPINPVLVSYSDLAYGTALIIYLLALVLHAVEYAADRIPAGTAGRPGAGDDGPVATLAPVAGSPPRRKAERIGRCAIALTGLAMLLHGGSLVLRGAAIGRVPWANMYEFTSAICWVAVAGWLVALYRQRRVPENDPVPLTGAVPLAGAASLRWLGGFVLLPVVVLMFLGGTVLYARAAPLIPALNSYWITIHVSAAITATGIFLVSGMASVLYLISTSAGSWLPDRATFDRLAYRAAVVAFPIWTFAIITGAIWAEAAWGRYWGWDPKETCALVAWVVYAGYLHARATAGWRGSAAAWVNVVGFAVMLFNLFFVNIVVAGWHSYAGV